MKILFSTLIISLLSFVVIKSSMLKGLKLIDNDGTEALLMFEEYQRTLNTNILSMLGDRCNEKKLDHCLYLSKILISENKDSNTLSLIVKNICIIDDTVPLNELKKDQCKFLLENLVHSKIYSPIINTSLNKCSDKNYNSDLCLYSRFVRNLEDPAKVLPICFQDRLASACLIGGINLSQTQPILSERLLAFGCTELQNLASCKELSKIYISQNKWERAKPIYESLCMKNRDLDSCDDFILSLVNLNREEEAELFVNSHCKSFDSSFCSKKAKELIATRKIANENN